MEDSVYVIDESQINGIRNRILIGQYKILAIVAIPVFILESLSWRNLGTSFWLTIGMIGYLMLIYYFGANRAAKLYKTMKIVLNKDGVERKADGMPYQMIPWADLIIQEKTNGTINLNNKNVSSFIGKMFGKDRIVIHPEILNRQALLSELFKRAGKY